MTELVDTGPDEPTVLDRGRVLLAELVSDDQWLPDALLPPGQTVTLNTCCTATRSNGSAW